MNEKERLSTIKKREFVYNKYTYQDNDKNNSSYWVLFLIILMGIPIYYGLYFINYIIEIDTKYNYYKNSNNFMWVFFGSIVFIFEGGLSDHFGRKTVLVTSYMCSITLFVLWEFYQFGGNNFKMKNDWVIKFFIYGY